MCVGGFMVESGRAERRRQGGRERARERGW